MQQGRGTSAHTPVGAASVPAAGPCQVRTRQVRVCVCVCARLYKGKCQKRLQGPAIRPFVLLMCQRSRDLLKFSAAQFLSPKWCPLLINGFILKEREKWNAIQLHVFPHDLTNTFSIPGFLFP